MDVLKLIKRSYELMPKYNNESSRSIEVLHVVEDDMYEVRMYLYANKKQYVENVILYENVLESVSDREVFINIFIEKLVNKLMLKIIDSATSANNE